MTIVAMPGRRTKDRPDFRASTPEMTAFGLLVMR
jgi:hypothetical protein